MLDGDYVSRLAIFPKYVVGNDRVFDSAAYFDFQSDDKKTYVSSVASRWFLKEVAQVHAYGCRTAQRARDGRPDLPDEKVAHYVGFYDIQWGRARRVPTECHAFEIKWFPEHGEEAHFDIRLSRNAQGTRKQALSDRAAICVALGELLNGPYRHVCVVDEELRERLELVDLPMKQSEHTTY